MISEMKISKRSLWFIGAIALAAIIVVAVFYIRSSSKNGVYYKEVAVKRGDIDVSILSTGIVQPENRLEIKPPIAGRIEEVLVEEGDCIRKGQILVRMSSTERAALLDAARARGSEELKRWQTFYRSTPILAPIDGTIILRNVEPGQSFTTQDAVLVMSDRLTVKAQVDETDIAQIRLNQKATVILDAYPDEEIPAHVDRIAYDATTISNVTTYIVDVLPEETPGFMRSGMTANVRFAVDLKENVLFLPANALKNREGHFFVLVPGTGHMSAPVEKEVETGITNGRLVEIVSGLAEGDVVLVQQRGAFGNRGTSSPFSPLAPRRR